jgi:hypothetical protein
VCVCVCVASWRKKKCDWRSMSYYSRPSSNTAASQKKSTSDRNQQVLRTLLNDPGNKYCADCKVAGHPRWASWSIGAFLCIRCVFGLD